jgi:hypothetical protein
MTRDVVTEILGVLDPHLERIESAWLAQPEGDRVPTLPLWRGKVCVRQIVRDLELGESDEQFFYDKPELAGPINTMAVAQGVEPIGSTMRTDGADGGVRKRLGRDARTISDLRRSLAEREAANFALREENARLRARLEIVEETGLVVRTPA